MKTISILFFLAITLVQAASANNISYRAGHDLLKFSNLYLQEKEGKELSSDESWAAATFRTYIEGYMGGIRISQTITKNEFLSLPKQPTHEQYARVINNYLKKNPEKLHVSARVLMFIALNEAFPKTK